VLGGRIYRGATGAAGEFGHMLVALDISAGLPAPTRFPQPGSIESIAAGRALDRLAHQIGLAGGGPDAVQLARDGDPAACEVVKRWARLVGIAVANAINIVDPEEVVLGGGAATAGELLLHPARDAALGYVLPGVGARTKIRLARHGVRAGVLGAALLAEHELCQTAG
jgi:glucokinase